MGTLRFFVGIRSEKTRKSIPRLELDGALSLSPNFSTRNHGIEHRVRIDDVFASLSGSRAAGEGQRCSSKVYYVKMDDRGSAMIEELASLMCRRSAQSGIAPNADGLFLEWTSRDQCLSRWIRRKRGFVVLYRPIWDLSNRKWTGLWNKSLVDCLCYFTK